MSAPAPSRRPAGAAIVLVLAGGLTLAGAGTATWVSELTVREVAGVPIEEVSLTAGPEVAGSVLPVGLAAAVLGLLLAVARGPAQRVVGGAAALLGIAGLVAVGVGALRAAELPGEVASAVPLAAAAALSVIAGGVLASRRPAAAGVLDERYTVEGGAADDDWALGSADEPPPGEGGR